MNSIDIFILIVVAFGLVSGWRKGAARQFIYLSVIVFFSFISQFFSPILSPLLVEYIGIHLEDSPLLATGIFFFFFLIVAALLSSMLTSLIKHTPLSFLNKLLGSLLGGMLLLCCLSYLFIIIDSVHAQIRLPREHPTEEPSARSSSLYYNKVKNFAPTLFNSYLLNKEKTNQIQENQDLESN